MVFGSSEDFTSDMKKIESTFYANEDIAIEQNKYNLQKPFVASLTQEKSCECLFKKPLR